MRRGFTLVEVMITILIIGILSAIAIPNFLSARTRARRNICMTNLKRIDSAKEQWAMDFKKSVGDACANTDIAGTGSYLNYFPACPLGGTYTTQVVGTKPTCSFAASPDLHVCP